VAVETFKVELSKPAAENRSDVRRTLKCFIEHGTVAADLLCSAKHCQTRQLEDLQHIQAQAGCKCF
jgi:hypothetical protein